MFKFIAQLIVSATVGLAVAAGSSAGVRGQVEKAWAASNEYMQGSANVVAHIASDINTQVDTRANASADVNTAANVTSEDTSTDSAAVVQTESSLNIEQLVPDVLNNVEANTTVETQAATDASVEAEDINLTLLQKLGLSLGFGLDE